MNPYEARPDKIPVGDRYAAEPFYGRYFPTPDDVQPDPSHFSSTTEDSLKYWGSILDLCSESNRVYEGQEGARDVFAVGSMIIKSSHMHAGLEGRRAGRDFSYADANEVQATVLARSLVEGIQVPQIYFVGKLKDRDVFIQERIPGVGLNVAWQYLSEAQKHAFKQQARDLLRKLGAAKPPTGINSRTYMVPDADPRQHRGIQELEHDSIFSDSNNDPDLGFMHNDLTPSNMIVNDDKIVGVVDWEMAGYFGWKTAGAVHRQIRSPRRENYAALHLPEETLKDILFWSDLYDV
ncbi:kinase-like domain-containing protein [Stachybotrys elegans]|uniref:Kinase-like domain-containing protein n=1 Tax=Stachybotrys elegans TaxID=80388 RepID=A0A8K0WMN8_9HYPO|nr:kinase-like domain-containing protein [Stachybotrys elegans]